MTAGRPQHRGAAAIVLDTDRRVLLVRWRREPGRWGLPGGRIDGDEEPHEAAVREVREETGLAVRVSRLVGIYSFGADQRPYLLMYAFLCGEADGEAAIAAPREIRDLGWFDPLDLPEPLENLTPLAVPDGVAGRYGVVRTGLPVTAPAD